MVVLTLALIAVAFSEANVYLATADGPVSEGTFWALAAPRWIMPTVMVTVFALFLWGVCTEVLRIPTRRMFSPETAPVGDAAHDRWAQRTSSFHVTVAAIALSLALMTLLSKVLPTRVEESDFGTRADAVWSALLVAPMQASGAVLGPIVLGLIVLVLGAARRPWWEICVLGAAVTVGMNASYGLPALGFAAGTLILICLYQRTGRLGPIIAAHVAVNALILLKPIVLSG